MIGVMECEYDDIVIYMAWYNRMFLKVHLTDCNVAPPECAMLALANESNLYS